MKSNVYYMVEELKQNNELERFTDIVYIELCKDYRYKNLISILGSMYNVRTPELYFHNSSTHELVKCSINELCNTQQIISINMVIEYIISNIEDGNVSLSVLDRNIIYNLHGLDKESDLYKMLVSKNIYNKDTICKSR